MLTTLKKIFTWWNQETIGTKIQTFFFGKLVGEDSFGNKYYQSKSGKRWVIYKDEIDASKIPNEWYSWIHFIANKIENFHDLKKLTFPAFIFFVNLIIVFIGMIRIVSACLI